MKRTVLLVLIAAAFLTAPAFAAVPSQTTGGVNTSLYHSYDGLICTDCHTLHSTDGDGATIAKGGWDTQAAGGYAALLQKGDFTDICLSCHKDGNNTAATADLRNNKAAGWTAPVVMTLDGRVPTGTSMPAGDFYYSNLDPKKGHNPAYTEGSAIATSKTIAADATLGNTPPGGAGALAGEWSCHSCHGMHSRFSDSYTAWRQIARSVNGIVHTGDVRSYGVESVSGNKTQNPAYEPIKSNSRGDVQLDANGNRTLYVDKRADNNALQGADLFADYSDTNHNVYQGGFSSFCATCHGNFHGGNDATRTGQNANTRNASGQWIKHPTNFKLSETVGQSNDYGVASYTAVVKNSQNTLPNPTGYDWKYPLVKGDTDFTTTRTTLGAVVGDDRIMCLSCHQAHASPFANMTRWDANGHAFIANGADLSTAIVGGSGTQNGDNVAFGCGKCHQKGGKTAFVKQF